jgi:hypothetical protein
VFDRALAKDPADRYGSCARFVAALRTAFTDAEGTTRILASPPPRRHARRSRWPVALGLCAVAGAVAAGVVATHRGSSPDAGRVTVTQRGTTVVQTVTAQQPTQQQSATTPAAPTSSVNGQAIALQGYDRLKSGDYAGAIPLLEQAARELQGTGTTDEAYNDYNLAYALAKTSGCSDRVLQLLDASESIQGRRTEIDRLRASCR